MAEPVSTWDQLILLLLPKHFPLLVTKLKIPPTPSSFPAYQFCTVEYLIEASSKAISSTTAACKVLVSNIGAVHPSR